MYARVLTRPGGTVPTLDPNEARADQIPRSGNDLIVEERNPDLKDAFTPFSPFRLGISPVVTIGAYTQLGDNAKRVCVRTRGHGWNMAYICPISAFQGQFKTYEFHQRSRAEEADGHR